MKRVKKIVFAGMLFSALAISVASAESPPGKNRVWIPVESQKVVKAPPGAFMYRYYPASQVYMDTTRNQWFYRQKNQWINARSLPAALLNGLGNFVLLQMTTAMPYTVHTEIITAYPVPVVQKTSICTYRYFPASAVYYDTGRKIWFHQTGGKWYNVKTLPASVKINRNEFVTVNLNTTEPYRYHVETVKKYPPGQLKKVVVHEEKVKYKEKHKGKHKEKYKEEYKEEYKGKKH